MRRWFILHANDSRSVKPLEQDMFSRKEIELTRRLNKLIENWPNWLVKIANEIA
jgi:hypothetical protein